MKDFSRHEEAKRLRDSGLTFKEVGFALGVGKSRAQQLVNIETRRQQEEAWRRDNPEPLQWWCGLSEKTAKAIFRSGLTSKESCKILCAEDLEFPNRRVPRNVFFSIGPYRKRSLPITVVNEVRAWLGYPMLEIQT